MNHNIMLPAPYRILGVTKETKAEYTFRVACDVETRHGQFFQLSIPKVGEAPISVSARGEGYLEFTIRKVGRLTDGVFGLAAGDTLFMRGPYGTSWPLDEFRHKDLALIAGGTGLAPLRSTLRHFADHPGEVRSLHLIAGFKDLDSVLFAEDLARFREAFHTIATLDGAAAPGFEAGMVTAHIHKIPFASFEDYNVAVVGPPVMMRFVAQELEDLGVPDEKIWVSFERKMSCAVGKCGHCKIDETYVCLEGPVFNYTKARGLLD
ncbi:MAG: anaerobic sulfite reductase subunit AsrB [Clostridiales Family XIII bacterium]|jgi:anaerobic sulfite reductase subunit B|nr:anaerobic sulfite reductase subunit AsrB [Clostridiales Family XIII bacterium]